MTRIFPARVASLLLAGCLLLILSTTPGAVGAAEPTVRPGERVHFTSEGFLPGERIDFWVTGPDGMSRPRFPAVPANDAGTVDWSWDVPADAPGGQWTAVARGIRSNLQVPSPFTVLASLVPPRELVATPPDGPVGTTFRFTVNNLRPGDRFGVWVRGPDGRDRTIGDVEDDVPTLIVDADGRISWEWTAPANSPPGAWRSLARSRTGPTTIEVPFTLTGAAPPAPVRSLEPVVGAPGTTFNIVVGGLRPGEVAGGHLVTPNGVPLDGEPYTIVDNDGIARWSWTAPADAQAGRWQAVTRGADSRIEVVLDLNISGANPAPAPTAGPSGSVEPAAGQPRSLFTFSVSGLASNDGELSFWFIDAKGAPVAAFEKIEVDSEGRASWTWQAPRLAEPGVWTMTARGRNSYREVTVPFTIEVPNLPAATADPAAAPAGSTFTFRATGFNVIERADTWVERPDRMNITGTFNVRADGDGVAVWNWTAPDDAAPGTWIMIIRGRDTDLTFRIPFTITP